MTACSDQSTSFVYSIYIRATTERVWQGLTDPAVMKRYWRHQTAGVKTFHSDWSKGSTYDMAHEEVGLVVSDPEQVILESDPYRRLAYTWHTITPEWAAGVGMDEATAAAGVLNRAPRWPSILRTLGTGSQCSPSATTGSSPVAPFSRGSPPAGLRFSPVSRPSLRLIRHCGPHRFVVILSPGRGPKVLAH